MKKNKLLIIMLASITIAAVFFVLNETFAWLSFFRTGQGQKFEAGYIETEMTASYAEYPPKSQEDTEKGYRYVPGDDLCEQPRAGDNREFRYLGFNLTFKYETQSTCVLRFKVEYQNTYKDPETDQDVTTALQPAFDKNYDYGTGANLDARNSSMILAQFHDSFVCGGLESGMTYWYYGTKTGNTINDTQLPEAPAKRYIMGADGEPLQLLSKLELAGKNIFIDTGRITIKITAQIRQFEAGIVTWQNYTESHFNLGTTP